MWVGRVSLAVTRAPCFYSNSASKRACAARAVRVAPLVVKRQLMRLLDQVGDFLEGFAAVVEETFVTLATIQLAIRRLART